MTEAADLRDLAAGIAREAGALLVHRLHDIRTEVATKSSATDMVSEVDRESEVLIVSRILAARPQDAILGEEGASREGSSGVRWVIDPLDGTTNYLYGHAGFAVSIGAELDGTTVAAVVHDPLQRDVFTATLGGGARRNGEPVHVSAERDLGHALVATGFSYRPERRAVQARVVTEVLPHVRDIRRMGAAAVDLCSVACGRVDAYFERGLNPWDMAAGWLVLTEAGGRFGGMAGAPADSDMVVAAAPGLFDALDEIVAAAVRSVGPLA